MIAALVYAALSLNLRVAATFPGEAASNTLA